MDNSPAASGRQPPAGSWATGDSGRWQLMTPTLLKIEPQFSSIKPLSEVDDGEDASRGLNVLRRHAVYDLGYGLEGHHEVGSWLPAGFAGDYAVQPSTFVRHSKSPYIIDYRSAAFMRWSAIMSFTNVTSAFFLPLQLAFFYDNGKMAPWDSMSALIFFVISVLVTFSAMLDVAVRFNLSYKEPNVSITTDRRTIVMKYLQGWFVLDLIAAAPYQILLVRSAKLYVAASQLRLLKLLHVLHMNESMSNYLHGQIIGNSWLMDFSYTRWRITRVVFYFSMVVHVLACGVYSISNLQGLPSPWASDTSQERYQMYIEAVYWAVMTATTVGYGELVVSTTALQLFATLSMIIGASMWAVIIATLTTVMAAASESGSRRVQKLRGINKFLQRAKFPKAQTQEILFHFSTSSDRSAYELGEIRYLIEDLSPSIRARLLWHVHGSWLRRCRFLCCVDDPSYLWEMSRLLTSEHYNPGEYLAVQGAGIRSLSIVHVGSILRESKLAIIGNALFGTEIILSKTHCYRDSYRALTPSVLWMMSKHSIGALIEAYPDMKKAIRAAAIRLAFALHVCEVLEEMSTKQNNPKP